MKQQENSPQRMVFHIENSPLAFVEWDHEFRVRKWSKKAEDIFGWLEEEVLGKSPDEIGFVHKADLDIVSEAIADLTQGRVTANVSHNRNLTRNGRIVDIEWYNTSQLEDGRLVCVISQALDVTQRKQMQLALEKSEQKLFLRNQQLEGLFEGAPAGLAMFDARPPYRVIAHNKFYQQLWEEPFYSEGVTGKTIMEFAKDAEESGTLKIFKKVSDTRKSETIYDFLYWDSGKQEPRRFDWNLTPIEQDGEVSALVLMIVERTDSYNNFMALEEERNRFQTMANSIPQLAWMTDETGCIYWYNQRWHDYTGTTLEETKGWGWKKVHHPDHVDRVVEGIKSSFENGKDWEDTFPLRSKKGGYRWFLSRAKTIKDNDGKVKGWFGTNTDVTEELKKNDRIRSSEKRLRRIIDNMATFIGELDLDGVLVEINAPALEAAGIRRKDVIGKKFWNCYWWSYDAAVQARLQKAFQDALQGKAVRYDVAVRMREGSLITIDFLLSPAFDNSGEIARIIPSGIDITDRKKAEKEVENSRNLLHAVTDIIPNPVFAKDKNRRIIFANKATSEAGQIKPEDILGKTDEEWLSKPENALQTKANDEIVLRTGKPQRFEEIMTAPDGKPRVFMGMKLPWRNEQGEIVGLVGGFTDITDLKEVQLKLSEENERKTRFLATLSHELRNPLAPVRSAFSLLSMDDLPDDKKKLMIETGQRSADHLSKLVDDLLDITRITRGKIEINKDKVGLASILEGAIAEVKQKIEEKKHIFSDHCADQEIQIYADAARIRQVVSNILGNSAKYTPPGGEIEFHCHAVNGNAEIVVMDNGPGIPQAMLDDVFDIFTQVDDALARSEAGLGIGLALVKELVEAHAGSVKAENRPQGGLKVTVQLPIAE